MVKTLMKAVIFDRDGIILDSESVNVESGVQAFKELKIPIKNEEKEWIIGRHPNDYKKLFEKKYKFSYQQFRKIQKATYKKLVKSVSFFDETISLIKKLKDKGVPLALTTTSSLRGTKEVLKKAGLESIFDIIVTFEDCDKRKPDPLPYLITAEKLGIKAKECVVIEDSVVGVEAAKRAGMKCIVIPNRYTKNQDFSKADLVVNSANKINIGMLKNL